MRRAAQSLGVPTAELRAKIKVEMLAPRGGASYMLLNAIGLQGLDVMMAVTSLIVGLSRAEESIGQMDSER